MNKLPSQKITNILKLGGIIAYPTEAVFGLGCDPFQKESVYKILELKKRSVDKGLILIASAWNQVAHLTKNIPNNHLEKALTTWPGPTTWLFPASPKAPAWITGKHDTLAIRITAHPVAKEICENFCGPIVSTSANIEGQPPAKNATEVLQQFPTGIDFIIDSSVGDLATPTTIKNVMTGKLLR